MCDSSILRIINDDFLKTNTRDQLLRANIEDYEPAIHSLEIFIVDHGRAIEDLGHGPVLYDAS